MKPQVSDYLAILLSLSTQKKDALNLLDEISRVTNGLKRKINKRGLDDAEVISNLEEVLDTLKGIRV